MHFFTSFTTWIQVDRNFQSQTFEKRITWTQYPPTSTPIRTNQIRGSVANQCKFIKKWYISGPSQLFLRCMHSKQFFPTQICTFFKFISQPNVIHTAPPPSNIVNASAYTLIKLSYTNHHLSLHSNRSNIWRNYRAAWRAWKIWMRFWRNRRCFKNPQFCEYIARTTGYRIHMSLFNLRP